MCSSQGEPAALTSYEHLWVRLHCSKTQQITICIPLYFYMPLSSSSTYQIPVKLQKKSISVTNFFFVEQAKWHNLIVSRQTRRRRNGTSPLDISAQNDGAKCSTNYTCECIFGHLDSISRVGYLFRLQRCENYVLFITTTTRLYF